MPPLQSEGQTIEVESTEQKRKKNVINPLTHWSDRNNTGLWITFPPLRADRSCVHFKVPLQKPQSGKIVSAVVESRLQTSSVLGLPPPSSQIGCKLIRLNSVCQPISIQRGGKKKKKKILVGWAEVKSRSRESDLISSPPAFQPHLLRAAHWEAQCSKGTSSYSVSWDISGFSPF